MQAVTPDMTLTGIGLRQPHYREVLEGRPALGFVEVHSENFFADGGAALAVLDSAREIYPVSLHGVGPRRSARPPGSTPGTSTAWRASCSACSRCASPTTPRFARAPLPPRAGRCCMRTTCCRSRSPPASLDIMVRNVTQVQERLRRSILVENLSAYLSFDDDGQMGEADFLVALCRRSGCQLLLDVNNLMVNALNAHAADPLAACCDFIDALPPGHRRRDPPRRLLRAQRLRHRHRRPRQPRARRRVGRLRACAAPPRRRCRR